MRTMLLLLCSILPIIVYAAERPKRPPPAVTEYVVETRQMPQIYVTSGTLIARKQAELRTDIAGRITELNAAPGQFVEQGTSLVNLDDRSAKAEYARLLSQLNLSKQQLKRQESLAKTMAGATERVDVQQAEVAGLESNLRIAELALEKHRLKAPFSGVLGDIDWVEGGWISNASLFTTLDDITALKVSFDLPERYLRFADLGRKVVISSTAWPEQEFEGVITLVLPRMNEQRATIPVQAEIDNIDSLLRPGMRVRVSVEVDSGEKRLAVPARSLIHEGDKTTVLLISEEKAKPTQVTLGIENAEWVEVLTGLEVGDRVIDRGLVKAKPNAPVKVLGAERPKS
mgnify:FL=1